MIIRKQEYLGSKWMNGKGETLQLAIQPAGVDFKQQKFDYRISIASLPTGLSSFSLFHNYHRWLLVLEGGPVTIRNLTSHSACNLQAQQQVMQSDGAHSMQSQVQWAGRDFNWMVRKDRKGGMIVYHSQGYEMVSLQGQVNFIYNCSQKELKVVMDGAEWILQGGQLFKAPQGPSITLHSHPNTTFIHCYVL